MAFVNWWAAQQVARSLQLTVVDVRGVEDRPSTLELDGEAVDPDRHMPLVLINPEVAPFGEPVAGGEHDIVGRFAGRGTVGGSCLGRVGHRSRRQRRRF